jgi:hypothetical protein
MMGMDMGSSLDLRRAPEIVAPASIGYHTQATLLNWLGQPPISFHRVYVNIAGNVVAGLWLSHALAKAGKATKYEFDGDDFIFSMSARECEEITGITRAQQAACRRNLSESGLLSEEGGQRRTSKYRLHMAEVARRMVRESEPLAAMLPRHSISDATDAA